MLIRLADDVDLSALLDMCGRFLRATRYRDMLRDCPSQQQAVVQCLIDQGSCWVLDVGDGTLVGMLGLAQVPVLWTGEEAAVECFWWVEPAWRRGRLALQLLDQGEHWARARGVSCIQLIEPAGQDGLAALYTRRGYVPIETTWHKPLTEGGPHGTPA